MWLVSRLVSTYFMATIMFNWGAIFISRGVSADQQWLGP
jgi:hypothetical protein